MKSNQCSLVGIPDHQAVMNVSGRAGAMFGPRSFRRFFSRMSGEFFVFDSVQDRGDVKGLGSDVVKNHVLAAEGVCKAHEMTEKSLVVGGGHDHGSSHLQGVLNAYRKKNPDFKLGCINIDAHLDVRKPAPLITSGSPFYLALEGGILQSQHLVEFGIQSHCNAPALWKYVRDRNIEVVQFKDLRGGKAVACFKDQLVQLSAKCDGIVISLDMDAFASAYSPGVSAPQAEGFTSMEVIEMMEIAGGNSKVVSLGIFELNPLHDQDDRSARLAATVAYHFAASL